MSRHDRLVRAGAVKVLTQKPTAAACAVAAAFGGQVKTFEKRVLVRRGKVVASGYAKVR